MITFQQFWDSTFKRFMKHMFWEDDPILGACIYLDPWTPAPCVHAAIEDFTGFNASWIY